VDGEVKVEYENEATFGVVLKCEDNLEMEVIEDMNEDIVNVEFYDELAFV
jgi:hypothetical protein